MRQNPDVLCMNVIKLFHLSIRTQSWSHRLRVKIFYSEVFRTAENQMKLCREVEHR